MAAHARGGRLAVVLALCCLASTARARPESHEFMELGFGKAQGDRELPQGTHQVVHDQVSGKSGLGSILHAAEDDGTRQLMLGGGLMILFFICIFMMHETEDNDISKTKGKSPKPSAKKLSKSGSSGKLKRASPQASPYQSPLPTAGRFENMPMPGETTVLLDDLRRQEEALKREEAEAWRRQEDAMRFEKDALLRREDELRARYERMEALNPKPALYIPSSSPVLYNTTPSSAPLYEPYAAREAREKRQALEATEQAIVQSSPYLSDREPFGTRPLGVLSPSAIYTGLGVTSSFQSDSRETRSFQAETYRLEEVRRDTEAVGGGSPSPLGTGTFLASPAPPATAPTFSSSYSFAGPTSSANFSAPLVPATAPSFGEENFTPEQKVTLQNIMDQTGASRESTIRAMKKARQEEEAILRELELRRQRAAATPQ